ncbi:nuclear transport factor 2 family protein [Acinetobacter seifertii]|uniref:nuclear transport factor 2 family protein n=1 Tax=Acinetobacter seifertii TaxID=1530123 RepID=UPI00168AA1D5|nr:DUF4440 domain-containing protein [Acinetobacter seifertii]QNX86352.1 DUF4440 domain-containing protein [Acinetobacter seifertii]
MENSNILSQIKSLEIEIHGLTTFEGRQRLDTLLHDEFVEIGKSGLIYRKSDVLNNLETKKTTNKILSWDFEIRFPEPKIVLMIYASCNLLADGTREKYALRSSIWKCCEGSWQMFFHQGTPTENKKPVK